MKHASCTIFALTLAAVAGGVLAQAYPSKPIRLVVPFAPGGPADIQARLIGPKLTEAWGQPVIVENRPGGNTIIATELTARAEPDGHLVQVISAGFAINTSLYAKLPYDSLRDFAPVTQLTSGPAIVVVHPSLPARSGRLRALATTGAKRSPATPDLPTMIEAGLPGYEAANWFGTAVPAKTPPAIVSKLSQEIARVLRLPDVGERLLSQGMEPTTSTPEEFAAYIRSEMTKWAKVVKASGAKAE